MRDFITLKRNAPEYLSYLLGTFARTHRALPVTSLNAQSETDDVVFQIVPVSQIPEVPVSRQIKEGLRIDFWIWSLFPVVVLLFVNFIHGVAFDPGLVSMNILSLICLQTSAQLWNDYREYTQGLQLMHPRAGGAALREGWWTAFQVRSLAWVFLVSGVILGIPALMIVGEVLAPFAILGVFLIFLYGLARMGFRYLAWAEVLSFFLFGPLLTLTFQLSMQAPIAPWVFILGGFSGTAALFVLQLRNFEYLVVNSKINLRSSVVGFGFERSKTWLWWLWLSLGIFWFLLLMEVFSLVWLLMGLGLFAWLALGFRKQLNRLSSPLGSGISAIGGVAKRRVFILLACALVGLLSQYLASEIFR